jgi:hypothetical protein
VQYCRQASPMQATSFAHGVCAHYDAASSSTAAYHLKALPLPQTGLPMYRCYGWGSLQKSADQQQVQLPAWPKRPNHLRGFLAAWHSRKYQTNTLGPAQRKDVCFTARDNARKTLCRSRLKASAALVTTHSTTVCKHHGAPQLRVCPCCNRTGSQVP